LLSPVVPAAQQATSPAAPPADAFGDGRWNLELGGQAFAEAWNDNGSHENLYGPTAGFTYGCRDGLMIVAAIPLFSWAQRTPNTAVLALTGGVRWRFVKMRRTSPFVELAVGVSRSEIYVP